jgi:hypothetical protein
MIYALFGGKWLYSLISRRRSIELVIKYPRNYEVKTLIIEECSNLIFSILIEFFLNQHSKEKTRQSNLY